MPQAPRTSPRRLAKGAVLNRGRSVLLVSGWACQARSLADGSRHIFGLLLPGDLVIAQPDSGYALSEISALTTVETVDIPDGADSVMLLLAEARLAEARHLDQLMRLGGLNAQRSVGHLLLEVHDRLESVGLVRDGRFHLPIGQRVIADVLGLSAVHINRTLQLLAREGLTEAGPGSITIPQPERLADYAGCPSSFSRLTDRRIG